MGARWQLQARTRRLALATAVAFGGAAVVAFPGSSSAAVTSVKGSAFGYFAQVSIFGGVQPQDGPTPTVTLPVTGSATPITATAPTGQVKHGPATFFTSGTLTVSTQGTIGPSGSVTSSSNVQNITDANGEVLVATSLASSCTAGATVSGSTTVTGGVLQTDSGDDTAGDVHPRTTVAVPTNPAPNTPFSGHIHVNGSQDNFHVLFNEQIHNPDGSLTVNAYHLFLDGPTATGDLIVGQSVCGVTGVPDVTTTTGPTTTTTTRPTTTTTQATTTTTQPTTTTTQPTTTTTRPTTTTTTTTPRNCSTPNGPISGLLVRIANSLPQPARGILLNIARLLCGLGL